MSVPTHARSPEATPRGGRLSRLIGYGASRTTVEGLLGVRGIVLARFLGPTAFGIWTLFRLALRYGAFAALGVHRGLELEVAASGPEGSPKSREGWGRSAVGFLFAVYAAIGVIAVGVSFFVASPARELLRAVAIGLLVERLWVYGSSYLRAEGRLRRFGIVELIQAAASLVLTASLAFVWGLVGAYVGFLVSLTLGIGLLGRSVPYRPELSSTRIRALFEVGVPLSIATIANTLLSTVDRLIVAGMEGTESLGFYAFAVAVSSIGASAAWIVRTVVFPEVYASARREGGVLAASAHLDETVVPVAHLLPAVLGVIAVGLGPAIAWAAPEYLPVLTVARLFIFAGVAAGILSLGTLGLVATERQRALPLIAFGGLALNAGAAVLALSAGFGLVGVAAGALVSRFLTSVGVVGLSAGARSSAALARIGLRLVWPTVWCAAVVVVLGTVRPETDLGSTAMTLALYVGALVPLLPGLGRQLRRLGRLPGPNDR